MLRTLNSRWWLPDLLNRGLSVQRFHRQYHRGLKIEPWRNRPCYPRELPPCDEGSTQIDLTISWENPPTTVYVEMKYGSDLSPRGAGDDGSRKQSRRRTDWWTGGCFSSETGLISRARTDSPRTCCSGALRRIRQHVRNARLLDWDFCRVLQANLTTGLMSPRWMRFRLPAT